MILLLNILWFVLGGFWIGLAWLLAAALMAVTVVGLPWTRAALTIAGFSFWPFGRIAVDRRMLTGREDIGTGPWGLLGNVVWFVLAGWWLALGHITAAALLGITIIGIPFALQHLKLALLAIAPIGRSVVPIDGFTP